MSPCNAVDCRSVGNGVADGKTSVALREHVQAPASYGDARAPGEKPTCDPAAHCGDGCKAGCFPGNGAEIFAALGSDGRESASVIAAGGGVVSGLVNRLPPDSSQGATLTVV